MPQSVTDLKSRSDLKLQLKELKMCHVKFNFKPMMVPSLQSTAPCNLFKACSAVMNPLRCYLTYCKCPSQLDQSSYGL